MRALLLIISFMSAPVFAAEPGDLVGVWKLLSWQVIVDNEPPQDVFGLHPRGYLILTREGRAIALTTAEDRKPGTTDAERAALHRSMLAYTGKYRIEGRDFVTRVDASWNEEWNDTEQRRHFRIEGDKLFIETAPAPSIVFPGKTDFRRIVWERER
jgi:lipocalin-like protein